MPVETDVIITKIDDLKRDIDKKIDELSQRIEKYEVQNMANFEKIIKTESACKSIQNELNEHKTDDKEYCEKLNVRVNKLESMSWKLIISIVASGLAGGGLGKILSIIF